MWQVQVEVSAYTAAVHSNLNPPVIGARVARLGRYLAFLGIRFSKPVKGIIQVGHIVLRSGREADLSICSPTLLSSCKAYLWLGKTPLLQPSCTTRCGERMVKSMLVH